MEHLWAPWRLEYIKGAQKKEGESRPCPFCLIGKEVPSEANLVHFSDENLFVIQNKFPYNPGHLLIIPHAHFESPKDLSSKVWMELALAQKLCIEVLDQALQPTAYNMGINLGSVAGAGIPQHLHWHLLPRWTGDTNFMPLLAETKALPTHNLTLYRQLSPHFKDFSERLSMAKMGL